MYHRLFFLYVTQDNPTDVKNMNCTTDETNMGITADADIAVDTTVDFKTHLLCIKTHYNFFDTNTSKIDKTVDNQYDSHFLSHRKYRSIMLSLFCLILNTYIPAIYPLIQGCA